MHSICMKHSTVLRQKTSYPPNHAASTAETGKFTAFPSAEKKTAIGIAAACAPQSMLAIPKRLGQALIRQLSLIMQDLTQPQCTAANARSLTVFICYSSTKYTSQERKCSQKAALSRSIYRPVRKCQIT
jgi:hypothetical protein